MKNKIIILIVIFLILAGVVWMMKPDDSPPIASSSAVVSEFPLSDSREIQVSSEGWVDDKDVSTQPDVENIEQDEVIETRSELSMQPREP